MPKRYMEVQTPNKWLGQSYDEVWDEVVEAIKEARDCADPDFEYNIDHIVDAAYTVHRDAGFIPQLTIEEFWVAVTNAKKFDY